MHEHYINTTPDTIKILLLKCFTLWLLRSRVPITISIINATITFKLTTYMCIKPYRYIIL